jgi:hypothetical protein
MKAKNTSSGVTVARSRTMRALQPQQYVHMAVPVGGLVSRDRQDDGRKFVHVDRERDLLIEVLAWFCNAACRRRRRTALRHCTLSYRGMSCMYLAH